MDLEWLTNTCQGAYSTAAGTSTLEVEEAILPAKAQVNIVRECDSQSADLVFLSSTIGTVTISVDVSQVLVEAGEVFLRRTNLNVKRTWSEGRAVSAYLVDANPILLFLLKVGWQRKFHDHWFANLPD